MISIKKHDNALEILLKEYPHLDTSCGGHGRCGKCRFQITKGELPVTEREKAHLSMEQLAQGIRLACEHTDCEQDVEVECITDRDRMEICGLEDIQFHGVQEDGCVLAVDIGTTTVVMVLLDMRSGTPLLEKAFLNPQCRYGADVISRIEQAHIHGPQLLQTLLLKELRLYMEDMLSYPIRRMCVCGNAVMTHLFLGMDPISLATPPYDCIQKELAICSSQALFLDLPMEFEVQVLPPISAYVGSDIVMGIYAQKMERNEKSKLLLDLGTNGELALFHDGVLTVSSAACGPAFEGGNMSCGSGAVAGAVREVTWLDGFQLHTIQHEKPNGICGSGYLSLMHCLLANSMLDTSGYLGETLQLCENIYLTQKDVREFQLAKSAIAAALERVCAIADCRYDQIEKVYLAGGFGRHLQVEDLCSTGILPQCLKETMQICGNTALKGCCQYALRQDKDRMDAILRQSHCVLLASDPMFSDAFIGHMMMEPFL